MDELGVWGTQVVSVFPEVAVADSRGVPAVSCPWKGPAGFPHLDPCFSPSMQQCEVKD